MPNNQFQQTCQPLRGCQVTTTLDTRTTLDGQLGQLWTPNPIGTKRRPGNATLYQQFDITNALWS